MSTKDLDKYYKSQNNNLTKRYWNNKVCFTKMKLL